MNRVSLVPVVFVVLALVTAGAATVRENAEQAASITEAAQAFLEALTPDQRAAASFPFIGEDRFDWHFIPRERKGVPLKTMTAVQQDAALALVRASLSAEGYDKSERIRRLEQILFEREGRDIRDTELYFFMIFGEPSASGTWAWRYEGHHLSHSWTIVDGRLSASTPQFFGTNPAHVRVGSQAGEKVLAAEEYYARSLLGSLSPALQRAAILADEAPRDILTTNERQAAMQDDTGVAYSQLDSQQQNTLWRLIEEYAAAQPAPIAEERLDKVRGGSRKHQVRLDGRYPGGRRSLLPRAGADVPDRVRQRAERRQPRAQRLARLRRGFRTGSVGRAPPGLPASSRQRGGLERARRVL